MTIRLFNKIAASLNHRLLNRWQVQVKMYLSKLA